LVVSLGRHQARAPAVRLQAVNEQMLASATALGHRIGGDGRFAALGPNALGQTTHRGGGQESTL